MPNPFCLNSIEAQVELSLFEEIIAEEKAEEANRVKKDSAISAISTLFYHVNNEKFGKVERYENYRDQSTSIHQKRPKRSTSSSDQSVCSTSTSSSSSSSSETVSLMRKKKRGRPPKQPKAVLPSKDDESLKHLPPDEKVRIVDEIKKIKNNESSRKYRINAKSRLEEFEVEYDELLKRYQSLKMKTIKYDKQITALEDLIKSGQKRTEDPFFHLLFGS